MLSIYLHAHSEAGNMKSSEDSCVCSRVSWCVGGQAWMQVVRQQRQAHDCSGGAFPGSTTTTAATAAEVVPERRLISAVLAVGVASACGQSRPRRPGSAD